MIKLEYTFNCIWFIVKYNKGMLALVALTGIIIGWL